MDKHRLNQKKNLNLTTLTKADKIVLKELAFYKWGHCWYCTKCGNDIYIQGKKEFSRRCKKCRYDESILKYTAFEGLRFPIATAYNLLNKIISTAVVQGDMKIVPVGKHQPGSNRPQKYTSLNNYILRCKKKGMDPLELDAKLLKIIDRQRPSVRELSRIYGIEENTITMLLDKINARIGLNEMVEYENSHDRLISFINEHYDKEPDFYHSLLMVPLVGNWRFGEIKINSKHYALSVGHRELWSVYEVILKDDECGNYTNPFTLNERIEYGTEEWKKLFVQGKIA